MNNHQKLSYLYVVLCLVIAIPAIAVGFWQEILEEPETAPLIIWEIDEVREPVHHLVEVETPIYFPIYVEVEKQVVIPPENWNSLDELKGFLKQDDTDNHSRLIANEQGIVYLTGYCEEKAFQLRDRAEAIGKRLETESLTKAEYILFYGNSGGLKFRDRHEVCKAVIGNEVWFVEPSTDEIWPVYFLD